MPNLISTTPLSKFSTWAACEKHFQSKTGDHWWNFHLVNTPRKPRVNVVGQVCFKVYDGIVRGYFDIVALDPAHKWHRFNDPDRRQRKGYSIIMANWHPLPPSEQIAHKGFQGFHYTDLRP